MLRRNVPYKKIRGMYPESISACNFLISKAVTMNRLSLDKRVPFYKATHYALREYYIYYPIES